MNKRDGQCPFCRNTLNPSTPFCPTCGEDILAPRAGKLIPETGQMNIWLRNQPIPRTALAVLAVVVLTATTISLLIIGVLPPHTGGGQVVVKPQPQATPIPTPTPIPTAKVTIKLIDVFCNVKESTLGWHDQFYTLTTFSAPDKNPSAQANTNTLLTKPIDINSGQDLPLSLTVFDGQVPQQGNVIGGFTAYNDEQGLGWSSNLDAWNTDIGQTVTNDLTKQGINSKNLNTVTTANMLDWAENAWYQTANLSSGSSAHQLGSDELTVSASGLASESGVWHFHGYTSATDNWYYTVKYQITRTPV